MQLGKCIFNYKYLSKVRVMIFSNEEHSSIMMKVQK